MLATLMRSWLSMLVTAATVPLASSLRITSVLNMPLKFTSMPSSLLTMMRPPPMDEACMVSVLPSALSASITAVLGWASRSLISSMV